MRREKSHPSWWLLYLLVLGTIGLLVLGALVPMSERGHQAAAIGTLLLTWGLVELWLRANTAELLRDNEVILVPRSRPRAEAQTPDEECQPTSTSWRQPQAADSRWATEGARALRQRDGTPC
jgi:hypothetical protein